MRDFFSPKRERRGRRGRQGKGAGAAFLPTCSYKASTSQMLSRKSSFESGASHIFFGEVAQWQSSRLQIGRSLVQSQPSLFTARSVMGALEAVTLPVLVRARASGLFFAVFFKMGPAPYIFFPLFSIFFATFFSIFCHFFCHFVA